MKARKKDSCAVQLGRKGGKATAAKRRGKKTVKRKTARKPKSKGQSFFNF